jgi:uncharacterized phage protein (TIGR02218 family)
MTAASQVYTRAHIWGLVRADGVGLYLTDHDQPLTVGDQIYRPEPGLRLGAVEQALGFEPDTLALEGAVNADGLSEADLEAGLWDGATVWVDRLDWRDHSGRTRLFTGRLGEVSRSGGRLTAEVRGLKAQLNAPVGRVLSRTCAAVLGDHACGIALTDPRWQRTATLDAVDPAGRLRVTLATAADPGWFAAGTLVHGVRRWAIRTDHQDGAGRWLTLAAPAGASLSPAAALVLVVGCDKRLATCRDRFANVANFRGFPVMPGPDFIVHVAQDGPDNDGGPRWSGG